MVQLPLSLEIEALLTALLGLWLFAEALGGRRERGAARALLAAGAALLVASRAPHAAAAAMALDAVLMAVLAGLSWRSARTWPAWMALLQGVVLAVHVVAFTRHDLPAGVYLTALFWIRSGQALVLAVGLSGLQPSAQAARAGLSE